MNADIKAISGGDGKILTFFTQITASNSADNSINELIMSCSESKESLSKLYTMFKDSVFAVAFSITSDYHLSEDCVIETFVRLPQIKRFSALKGDGKGFILTIARNVALELRRKYKKETVNYVAESIGEADKTVEDSIYINQLLKDLNDKQRQTVVLRCCADMTFKEIAKITEASEDAVKKQLSRGREKLKEKLKI